MKKNCWRCTDESRVCSSGRIANAAKLGGSSATVIQTTICQPRPKTASKHRGQLKVDLFVQYDTTTNHNGIKCFWTPVLIWDFSCMHQMSFRAWPWSLAGFTIFPSWTTRDSCFCCHPSQQKNPSQSVTRNPHQPHHFHWLPSLLPILIWSSGTGIDTDTDKLAQPDIPFISRRKVWLEIAWHISWGGFQKPLCGVCP